MGLKNVRKVIGRHSGLHGAFIILAVFVQSHLDPGLVFKTRDHLLVRVQGIAGQIGGDLDGLAAKISIRPLASSCCLVFLFIPLILRRAGGSSGVLGGGGTSARCQQHRVDGQTQGHCRCCPFLF